MQSSNLHSPTDQYQLPKDINDYILPKNSIVYYSTPFEFIAFKDNEPTWFAQEPCKGFTIKLSKLLDTEKVDKSSTHQKKDQVQTLPSQLAEIYVRKCVLQKDLKLFQMSLLEAESRAHLTTLGLNSDILNSHWYGMVTDGASTVVNEFCAKMVVRGYDGWINPLDQAEIMICQTNTNIQCNNDRICPRATWSLKKVKVSPTKPPSLKPSQTALNSDVNMDADFDMEDEEEDEN